MREIALSGRDLAVFSADILSRGGTFRLRAKGVSMQPFVWGGNILTIVPVATSTLKIRDIVLYKSDGGELIAHRLIGYPQSDHTKLLIKGDSYGGAPVTVLKEQVLGRISEIHLGGKRISCDSWMVRYAVFLWIETSPVSSFLFKLIKQTTNKFTRLFAIR